MVDVSGCGFQCNMFVLLGRGIEDVIEFHGQQGSLGVSAMLARQGCLGVCACVAFLSGLCL